LDGVVAYVGDELRSYGNLVIIRHDDGFVTAYAHASRLLVKVGDKVRRGQPIAKSGQTGNVSEPQLHFEIRQAATPVDPEHYLPRGCRFTAAPSALPLAACSSSPPPCGSPQAQASRPAP